MSNDTSIDDIDADTNPNEDNLKNLRQRAASATAAEAEAAKARRELMFLRAGIDPASSDPKHAKLATMLFNTFDGDDLDALKNEAREIGLLDVEPAQPRVSDEDRQQQDFRRNLSRGPAPDPNEVPTPDPATAALEGFHKNILGGVEREDATIAAFGEIFAAAGKGDARVIHDRAAWERTRQEAGNGS